MDGICREGAGDDDCGQETKKRRQPAPEESGGRVLWSSGGWSCSLSLSPVGPAEKVSGSPEERVAGALGEQERWIREQGQEAFSPTRTLSEATYPKPFP